MDRKAGSVHSQTLDGEDGAKNKILLSYVTPRQGIKYSHSIIAGDSVEHCDIKTGECEISLVKQRVH